MQIGETRARRSYKPIISPVRLAILTKPRYTGISYEGTQAPQQYLQPIATVCSWHTRLKNKDEVFTVLLARHPEAPLAISAEFLAATPVHHDAIEGTALVVLTDPSGANRAYASEDVTFARYDGDRRVEDKSGMIWTMDEHALTAEDGRVLRRIPAQRAFWFGWHAAFPSTRLVR